MRVLNNLTIRNLILNKKRTIVTIIGIILSTALMVGIGLLFSTFHNYMIKEVISYSGSYHARFDGLGTNELNLLKEEGGLDYFYEEGLGFSKIDSKNEYKPYLYINRVSDKYFDELTLIEGRFPENENEIVISSHISSNGGVNYKISDELTLDFGYRFFNGTEISGNSAYQEGEDLVTIGRKTYKIVGIVQRSQYEDYSASGYCIFTVLGDVNSKTNVFVTFDKTRNIIKQSKELAKKIGYKNDIKYNSSLIILYGDSIYSNVMGTMVGMLIIMLSLVSVGCIMVIYNSFAISVMERKRQFGLLASVGASKRELVYMVLLEAMITSSVGIVLGIGSAYLGIGIVVMILNSLLKGVLEFSLVLTTNLLFILIPVIFMLIVVLISAILPARRAALVSPIEAIRQNDDIKINKKKIRTRKFTKRLFGVEGEIALKNIKRNKKKYRITIISLFISTVLFISFSAYMDYTINFTDDMIYIPGYDIVIRLFDNENDYLEKAVHEISNHQDVTQYVKYSSTSFIFVSDFAYTKDYEKYVGGSSGDNQYEAIPVILLDDNSYNYYKEMIGLKEDKVILYNRQKGVFYGNGKRVNFDINVIKDDDVKLNMCRFPGDAEEFNLKDYCGKYLNNLFITDKEFDIISEISNFNGFKLIMNKRIFNAIYGEEESTYYNVNIKCDNCTDINKRLKELSGNNGIYYSNVAEDMKMENNLVIAVKILMYGFISLVTLIGVTSVFNTISTSMALRKKEFAVLRSVGLTRRGFNKILFFESLFFGLKSLLYSIPVSLVIIYLIHLSMSDAMAISGIIIPFDSILIAVIMIFVIVLATMLYSTSKIKKHNIIDEIREENI